MADVYARSEELLVGARGGFEVSMLSAALIAAGRFVSAALYVVNIFAERGDHATAYLGGFDMSLASVAEERNFYESVEMVNS